MADLTQIAAQVSAIQANVSELVRVCRNIITLASQYGFAGYVDIAAHNEDTGAHSELVAILNDRLNALAARVDELESKGG